MTEPRTCEDPGCFCDGQAPAPAPGPCEHSWQAYPNGYFCAWCDEPKPREVTQKASTDQSFAEFMRQMEQILSPTAAGKGYSTTGVDGQNALYEFVQSFAGDGHALGEIVYKAKRYAAKGDPTELVKIASWAFLIWRHR